MQDKILKLKERLEEELKGVDAQLASINNQIQHLQRANNEYAVKRLEISSQINLLTELLTEKPELKVVN